MRRVAAPGLNYNRMMKAVLSLFFLLGSSGSVPGAPPRTPVIIELFTSEGCSSCPPAEALLTRLLTGQPLDTIQIIPLEFHVDYWDRLGWKDPFSSPAFSKRQEDYAKVFGPDRLYTPQLVVDGATEVVGSDEPKAVDAIRKAAAGTHVPLRVSASMRGDAMRVSVEAPAAPAGLEKTDIIVALVEDGVSSSVRRGENGGRTLEHSAVVRRHQAIAVLELDAFVGEGEWRISAGWRRPSLRVVAFLQGQTSRRIYGATSAAVQ